MANRTVTLHSSVTPALTAGSYTLEVGQDVERGGPIDPLTRSLTVSGPRFTLAGRELLSTFPPANAVGSFDTRLPQVVLRRRTLPWERAEGTTPWVALVVLADAEATFLSGVRPVDAVTPGADLTFSPDDPPMCDALEVTETVVKKVFPTRAELELLCHVRHVDLSDTELAGGDDDGWLAVVMSNRLPQPDTRYGVYLISLEGQLGVLPEPREPVFEIGPAVVFELSPETIEAARFSSGAAATELSATLPPLRTSIAPETMFVSDAWSRAGRLSAEETREAALRGRQGSGFVAHDISISELVAAGVISVRERRLRFPVLAHWSFTSGERGDFRYLMQRVDIGLLGTAPPAEGRPPGLAPTRVEAADTGHLALDATTRRGEPARVWYRGPFTPRQISRRMPGTPGYVPMFNAADQARRVGGEGREDVSEAAAFELGRLLALSDPAVLSALRAWRRDGFRHRRRDAFVGVAGLNHLVVEGFRLDRALGVALLEGIAEREQLALGPPVPPIDLGDVLDVFDRDPVEQLAAGLGLEARAVEAAFTEGLMTAGVEAARTVEPETRIDALLESPGLFAQLGAELARTVERASRDAGAALEEIPALREAR